MRKVVIGMLVLLAGVSMAWAGTGVWTHADDPEGGSIYDIAVSHQNPDKVYAATGRGIYRSDNGGESWYLPGNSIPDCRQVVVDPDDEDYLYAFFREGNNLHRSTDGGDTWTELEIVPGERRDVHTITLTGGDPSARTIYAGVDAYRIFKSTDSGASWAELASLPNSQWIRDILVDGSTIYVALWEYGVYRSDDGGSSWTLKDSGLGSLAVTSLAVDGTLLLVGTWERDGGGWIYRSSDRGDSWTQAGSPGWNHVEEIIILPGSPQTVYAQYHGGLRVSTDVGSGDTWEERNNGLGGEFETKYKRGSTLILAPSDPNTMYIGGQRGVFRTDNAGGEWTPRYTGMRAHRAVWGSIAYDPINPSVAYAAINGPYSLLVTSDGGESWEYLSTSPRQWLIYVATHPTDPSIIYVTDWGAVLRSTDGGDTWTDLNNGDIIFGQNNDNEGCLAVAIDPQDPDVLYASTYREGNLVYKSTDSGDTWEAKNSDLPGPPGGGDAERRIRQIVIDPQTSTVYAVFERQYGVYRSTDGGDNWTQVNTGVSGTGWHNLTIDPSTTPSTLYLGASWGDDRGLYVSRDDGATWQKIWGGDAYTVAIDPLDPDHLFVAAWGEVRESRDGGDTWTDFSYGLFRQEWTRISVNPHNRRILTAGTEAGMYHYAFPETPHHLSLSAYPAAVGQEGELLARLCDESGATFFGDPGTTISFYVESGDATLIGDATVVSEDGYASASFRAESPGRVEFRASTGGLADVTAAAWVIRPVTAFPTDLVPTLDGIIGPEEYRDTVPFSVNFDDPTTPPGFVPYGEAPSSSGDFSYVMYAMYDAQNLYLAFDITDDAVHSPYGGKPWENDDVEIYIDGDEIGNDIESGWGNQSKEGFQIYMDAAGNGGSYLEYNTEWFGTVDTRAGGWIAEFRIPLASIDTQDGEGETPPSPGMSIGFNIATYDLEDPDSGYLDPPNGYFAWSGNPSNFVTNKESDWGQLDFSPTPLSEAVSVYLPDRKDVPLNRPYEVPVSVTGVTGKGFISLQTVLTYDGSIIRPLGILAYGTLTEGWTVDFNVLPGTSPDTLKIAMATAQDTLSGSGMLFTINVEAAEGVSVGDSTILHFESFQFNEDTTEVGTQDGVVYIRETVRLLGDVTDNGTVTAYDAAHILRHTVELLALTGRDSVAADVSGDATISAYDASLVLQYVVGMISRFPVEEGQQAKVVYASRTVRLGELQALPDGRMCLSILIDETDGVVAGEMTLSFSGDVGNVIVSTTDLTTDYLFAYNIQDSRIRLSFAGSESSTGPGTVLEVVFDEPDTEFLSSLRLDRVSLNEGRIPVRIAGREAKMPSAYRLSQNHPNPFNPETTIQYDLPEVDVVRLSVYALTGQLVRILVDAERTAGTYSVIWDGRDGAGRDVASGVYLCRMEVDDYLAVRKLLLVK